MKIEMFIGAVILSILVIDAIRYRIIYFKFKKFNICDYKEIVEHLNGMQKVSVPVRVGSETEEDPEALEEKMKALVEIMNKLSSFDTKSLKSLDKDLGYLLFHYTQIGECLSDMITFGAEDLEEMEKSAYNDIGGKDGD